MFSQPYVYYVSPWTGNDADTGLDTTNAWATIQKAFTTADAGDIVYFRGGEWAYTIDDAFDGNNMLLIDPSNHQGRGNIGHNGTYANPVCFFNYPNETPVLNFINVNPSGNFNVGIYIYEAHYIKFKGIEIKNLYQMRNPVQAFGINAYGCTNLSFENMSLHNISGNALRFLNGPVSPPTTTDTCSVINSDFYNNADTLSTVQYNYADGVKCDGDNGAYFYFYGNRFWNNTDDGLDMSGIQRSLISNNWFWNIGLNIGTPDDGNGLKAGGVRDSVNFPSITITNNIMAGNYRYGLHSLDYSPYYRNNARIYNNFFYANGQVGIIEFTNAAKPWHNSIYRNNIAYDNTANVSIAKYQPSYPYIESHNTWDFLNCNCNDNAPYTDTVTVSDADFVSLDTTQLRGARQADGSLPNITFGRLVGGSDLIGAGTNVGMTATPDIGIDWPYLDGQSATIYTNSVVAKSILATSGGNITSDGGATITERGIVWGTSANPTTSNNKIIVSGTTGSYSAEITGLSSNTTYYLRAYAINSVGTAYGAQVIFTTTDHSIDSNRTFSGGKVVVIKQ